MQTIVFLDGQRYESIISKDEEAKNVANALYGLVGTMDRFKLELKNGGFLVLGKEAAQRAHFIFKD